MTLAIKAFNTILQYDSGTNEFLTVAEVTNVGGGFTDTIIPVTNMESDQGRVEKIKGLMDEGEITLEVNYVPGSTTHQQILTDRGVSRAWRLVLPNYAANSVDVSSIATATEIITTSAAHGFLDGQPIKFVTTGVLPTSSPQIIADNLYYAELVDADEFVAHTTSADAVAGTNDIDFSTAGTGTHSVLTGSILTFTGIVQAFSPGASVDGVLTASITIAVTGQSTYPV